LLHRFIREASELPVMVESGEIWLDDRPIGLKSQASVIDRMTGSRR
jgi:sulfate transport system ATP-binding protein